MSSKDNLHNILRFARAYCAERLPWFAPALFKCKIQLTELVAVAAIDMNLNVYFNPEVIDQIDRESIDRKDALAQIGFLWIHEISHILREHSERAKAQNADAKLWNIAADLEINDSNWSDLIMPKSFPGLLPQTYNLPTGQITEFYYKKILQEIEEHNQQFKYVVDEGEGVHGHSRPWELEGKGLGDGQVLDPLQLDIVRRAVAKEMQDTEVGIGTLPGGWKNWAREMLKSKVDWRKKLRHRMKMSIATGLGNKLDYSFQRPSRRQSVYHPILPPTLSGQLNANIACVVDTSGSMDSRQLNQALAEIQALLKAFQSPVTIIPCDAKAYRHSKIAFEHELFTMDNLAGGGGTDMRVGITAALNLRPKPDAILVLTDGYTPFPARPFKTPVLFGLLGKNPPKPPNPPWQSDTVVHIDLL